MKGQSHDSNAGREPKVLLAKDCPFGELVAFHRHHWDPETDLSCLPEFKQINKDLRVRERMSRFSTY